MSSYQTLRIALQTIGTIIHVQGFIQDFEFGGRGEGGGGGGNSNVKDMHMFMYTSLHLVIISLV